MKSQLPQVIPQPHCILYESNTDIVAFRFGYHLKARNMSTIKYLAGALHSRRGKSETEIEALNIPTKFINEHSNLKSIAKEDKSEKKDSDDYDQRVDRGKHHRSNTGDEDKRKTCGKGKKGDDDKGDGQVYARKGGRQKALSTINNTLTTTQDSMSRVVAISDDLTKSRPMASATVLPLQQKKTHIKKPSVCLHKQTANGVFQWSKHKGFKLFPSNKVQR